MLFCASKVWTQGGYEANYVTHAKFQAAIASDPTLLHTFLETWTLETVILLRAAMQFKFTVLALDQGTMQRADSPQDP